MLQQTKKERKQYQIVYPTETKTLVCKNLENFISEVFENSFERDEDPVSIICPEYGKLPYSVTLYHACFAKGRISEAVLIKMLKEKEANHEN